MPTLWKGLKSDGNFFQQDAFKQASSAVTTDITTPRAQEERKACHSRCIFQVYLSKKRFRISGHLHSTDSNSSPERGTRIDHAQQSSLLEQTDETAQSPAFH